MGRAGSGAAAQTWAATALPITTKVAVTIICMETSPMSLGLKPDCNQTHKMRSGSVPVWKRRWLGILRGYGGQRRAFSRVLGSYGP